MTRTQLGLQTECFCRRAADDRPIPVFECQWDVPYPRHSVLWDIVWGRRRKMLWWCENHPKLLPKHASRSLDKKLTSRSHHLEVIVPFVRVGTPHFTTVAMMLNFGKACRVFVSPAASQASIATASDVNTKLENGGCPKELERMFDASSRMRFAARQSTDLPLVCDNSGCWRANWTCRFSMNVMACSRWRFQGWGQHSRPPSAINSSWSCDMMW